MVAYWLPSRGAMVIFIRYYIFIGQIDIGSCACETVSATNLDSFELLGLEPS